MRKLHVISKESIVKDHYDHFIQENGAEYLGYPLETIYESKFHGNGRYKKVSYIGEFNVDLEKEIDEGLIANQIKDKKKTLNYQICVYDGEGPIPHFHVIENAESNRSKKMDCCICIFEAKFFDHGTHTDLLNSKELKILNNFLKTNIGSMTYWKFIAFEWYRLNPDNAKKYPQNNKTDTQPDYTKTNTITTNPVY